MNLKERNYYTITLYTDLQTTFLQTTKVKNFINTESYFKKFQYQFFMI